MSSTTLNLRQCAVKLLASILAPASAVRSYNTLTVTFDPVDLKLAPDINSPSKIRFYLVAKAPVFQVVPGATPDKKVLDDNGLILAEFLQSQRAIQASATPVDILDGFISSIPLLGIIEAMDQFQNGLNFKVEFDDSGYIIVHGASDTVPTPSCGPGSGTQVETVLKQFPKPSSPANPDNPNGFTMKFTHSPSPISATPPTYSPTIGYYYPLSESVTILARNIIGPGVVASDDPIRICKTICRWT